MAIAFQGFDKTDVNWAQVTKIEIRQQGTGSFVNVGLFDGFTFSCDSISKQGENGTQYTYALKYDVGFTLIQSAKAAELATVLAGTAGTGLLETDVEIKFTFVGGRAVTLGAVSGYPMRLTGRYSASGDGAQIVECSATVIEAITTLGAKLSA